MPLSLEHHDLDALHAVLQNEEAAKAVTQARALNIPWQAILAALAPAITALLTNQPIPWGVVIANLWALINPPMPAPGPVINVP